MANLHQIAHRLRRQSLVLLSHRFRRKRLRPQSPSSVQSPGKIVPLHVRISRQRRGGICRRRETMWLSWRGAALTIVQQYERSATLWGCKVIVCAESAKLSVLTRGTNFYDRSRQSCFETPINYYERMKRMNGTNRNLIKSFNNNIYMRMTTEMK